MNLLDVILIAILVLFAFAGYKRGLIQTVFKLVSFFVAIVLSYLLYPYVSQTLRQTPVFAILKANIEDAMNLRGVVESHAAQTQTDLINSLSLPAVLRDALHLNNTPDVYELLNVRSIEDYISSFFSNITLNVMSMVLVFILVWLVMRLIGGALNIVSKLPVINLFNRAGGLVAGLAMGLLIVWVGLTLMNLFILNTSFPEVFALIKGSLITQWLFDNNWLTQTLARIV